MVQILPTLKTERWINCQQIIRINLLARITGNMYVKQYSTSFMYIISFNHQNNLMRFHYPSFTDMKIGTQKDCYLTKDIQLISGKVQSLTQEFVLLKYQLCTVTLLQLWVIASKGFYLLVEKRQEVMYNNVHCIAFTIGFYRD